MTNSQTKISTFYYNKSGNFCLIVCHEALFNWKLFKLGSVSVKDIRKNAPVLQVGGSSHIPSTPPVVWVVLLHKTARVCNPILYVQIIFVVYFPAKLQFSNRLVSRDEKQTHGVKLMMGRFQVGQSNWGNVDHWNALHHVAIVQIDCSSQQF